MSHFGIMVLMLKCEQDCIHYKGILYGISKPTDKKPFIVMIQMHDEKTMLKKIKCLQTNQL